MRGSCFSNTYSARVDDRNSTYCCGTDSFTFQASDGILNSNVATATIAVTEGAPIASNASVTMAHDKTLNGSVHATDPDHDSLTYAQVSSPQQGTLTFNASGTFTYVPPAGYSGTVSFTYQASDGMDTSNLATVMIGVNENAPIAVNNVYDVPHDATFVATNGTGVQRNDKDAESDKLTTVLVTNVSHGTLTLNPSGSFTYIPAAGYVGPDSFTYRDSDGLESSGTATVTFNVVEHAPVASNDAYSIGHNHTLTATGGVGGTGVLGNATDADGDPLTVALVSNVSHGTLSLNANGSFSYTPSAGYIGSDSFSFQVSDGILTSAVITAAISVLERPPVAGNNSYAMVHDQPLSKTAVSGVLANDSDADSDAFTLALVAGPTHGTLVLNANGSFSYTPAAHYVGTDKFSYQDSDGLLPSNVATVTIQVTDAVPVAVNDAYVASVGQSLTATAANGVLANDTDANHEPLTATVVTGPAHGTLVLNADGSFVYNPAAGYSGTDGFTYQVSDGLLSSTATATITIGGAPHPLRNKHDDPGEPGCTL